MSCKKPNHSKQFKLDAVNYRKGHPDLTLVECAKNLEIGVSTLARWEAQFSDDDGDIPTIGSGCYESEDQGEIARLKRALRDTQDALDVLKKAISIDYRSPHLCLWDAQIFRRFPLWLPCFSQS